MLKSKLLKQIIIGFFCLIPFGVIVGLSVNWSQTKFINCVGSSGVKPFLEIFADQYSKFSHNKIDISVEAGGSGFGIKQISDGYTNIGTASLNPYPIINQQTSSENNLRQKWKEKNIKTVTIGWEAICLVYKMPNGLSNIAQDNFEINIDEENINYLYIAFSGFNENLKGKFDKTKTSFYNFLSKKTKEIINKNNDDKLICQNAQIIPYVRSGGNIVSGTADAFYNNCYGLSEKKQLTSKQKNAFLSGQYGFDRRIYETDEANSRAWDMFSKNKLPNSMVYLSSSFIENNKELIATKNFKIAKYNENNYQLAKIANGYNWYRPINCLLSIDDETAKNFLTWLFSFSVNENNDFLLHKNYYEKIKKIGAKNLEINELESMKSDKNFWVNDIDLELENSRKNIKTYGAIKQ